MARHVSGLLKAVCFLFIFAVLFAVTLSPARALSTACTALNAASPVSSGLSTYNASSFSADETLTVSFTDSGAGAGGLPMNADTVIMQSRDFSQHYLVHYSSDGNAGSFSTTVTGAQLTAGGLWLKVSTANGFISPVTVSCTAAATLSSDATLSGLSFSGGALSPGFSAGNTSYHATVDYAVTSVTLTPITTHSAATVTVNGSVVSSGSASPSVNLSVGVNTLTIVVTAEDGTTKNYSLTIQRNEQTPVAGNVSAQVAANSQDNPIALALSGGTATAVNLVSAPQHGTLMISGTTVTYTPLAGFSGNDSFSYNASNSAGTSTNATVSLTITAPAAVTISPASGALAPATVGTALSQTFAVNGGAAPYRWQLSGSLPAGLTFSGGLLKGTPGVAGDSAFTLSATDANGVTVHAAYTLHINAAAAQAVDQNASLSAGRVTRVSLTRGATGGPFTGARLLAPPDKRQGTASIQPQGGDYELTFTAAPQASGTVVLRYVLLSASGITSPATITFSIASRPDPSKDASVTGTVSAQYQAAQNFARAQIRNFNDRLEQLHGSEDVPSSLNGVHFALPTSQAERGLDTDLWNAALQQQAQLDAQNSLPPALPLGTQTPGQRLSYWTGGYVDFGRDKDATMRLSHTLVGVSTGVDYRFTPTVTAGVGMGFGRDVSDIGDTGTRSNGRSLSTALYASYHPDGVFIDGLLGYSRLDFDSKRHVSETDIYARGSRAGSQVFGALTSGYEFRLPQSLVSPYGRVQVSQTHLESYTESDAGMYNLAFAPQRFSQVTGSAGLRAEHRVPVSWGDIRLQSRVEYSRLMNDTGSARVGYADTGNDTWRMSLYEQNRQTLALGVGLDMALPNGVTPGLAYQGTLGLDDRGSRAQTIMARMNVAF
ncbi:autotransporter domain-containing protein [Cronobacter malonaticus]